MLAWSTATYRIREDKRCYDSSACLQLPRLSVYFFDDPVPDLLVVIGAFAVVLSK
jgi:hypothetical protein